MNDGDTADILRADATGYSKIISDCVNLVSLNAFTDEDFYETLRYLDSGVAGVVETSIDVAIQRAVEEELQ